jgi:subtilisin family serine protease
LPSVVAVGAVDVDDPGLDNVEPFSSHGPARIDFPTPELRAKPDLVAFDGVAISNAGGFPACPPFCAFFGTSAAAPHSAGVAALLLDQDPTLTPAEVKAALTGGAVDVGAPGFDDASGFGRLDAVAAADTLTDSTTTTSSTTTTVPTSSTTTSTPTTRLTTTTTSLVVTNTPPTVSIDDLPDKVRRKDLARGRLLTLRTHRVRAGDDHARHPEQTGDIASRDDSRPDQRRLLPDADLAAACQG